MNTKYIVSSVLVAGALMVGVSSASANEGLAFNWHSLFGRLNIAKQEVRRSESPRPSVSKSPRPSPSASTLACLAAAANARESALSVGVSANSDAIKAAYSARASALATAYAKPTTDEIRIGVKAAWSQFDTSIKSAAKSWRIAQKNAWSQFKTASKACGNSEAASLEGEGHEVSGD